MLWNQNICLYFWLKQLTKYCLFHTVLHVWSLTIKFLKKFLPINCEALIEFRIQQNWNQEYIQVSIHDKQLKTPPVFLVLVHKIEHLVSCIMRKSGIVRHLINPSWQRKMTVFMVLSYTHWCKDIMCSLQVKVRGQSHTAVEMWHMIQ